MVGVTGFEPATSSSRKSTGFEPSSTENHNNVAFPDPEIFMQKSQELAEKIRMILQLAESACSAYAPQEGTEEPERE